MQLGCRPVSKSPTERCNQAGSTAALGCGNGTYYLTHVILCNVLYNVLLDEESEILFSDALRWFSLFFVVTSPFHLSMFVFLFFVFTYSRIRLQKMKVWCYISALMWSNLYSEIPQLCWAAIRCHFQHDEVRDSSKILLLF